MATNQRADFLARSGVRIIPLVAIALVTAGSTSAADLGNRLERPVEQIGVHNSTSAIETTYVWPSGSGNKLEFDYYVDSEPGWDFLKCFIDGSVAYSWSGLSRGGHVVHPLATGGSHTVRFEYYKDGSVNAGRDTAWVDNISVVGGSGVISLERFDHRFPSLSAFTPSGTGGGFRATLAPQRRVIRRPVQQAFSGYIGSPTTSRIERTINWPNSTGNYLSFRYLVDSEQNYDFLRVVVDGTLRFSTSGRDAGYASVDVGAAGNHTVAFEYYKDTSVDSGRDLALIEQVVTLSGTARGEWWDFAGTSLSSTPAGWTASGSGGGWLAADPPPTRAYLVKSAMSPEPSIDGRLRASEYASATVFPLYDVGSADGDVGTAWLRESETTGSLFIGLRVRSSTVVLGSESGEVTLLFDAGRLDTLSTIGCGVTGTLPSLSDRKVVFTYSSTTGHPTASTPQQYGGTCQNWIAITGGSGDEWPTTVAVSEPVDDPGFVHIETKIELKPRSAGTSSVVADGKVGFALVHRNLSGRTSRENLPVIQSTVLPDNNVVTWLTLDFAQAPTYDAAHGEVVAYPAAQPAYVGRLLW